MSSGPSLLLLRRAAVLAWALASLALPSTIVMWPGAALTMPATSAVVTPTHDSPFSDTTIMPTLIMPVAAPLPNHDYDTEW